MQYITHVTDSYEGFHINILFIAGLKKRIATNEQIKHNLLVLNIDRELFSVSFNYKLL